MIDHVAPELVCVFFFINKRLYEQMKLGRVSYHVKAIVTHTAIVGKSLRDAV